VARRTIGTLVESSEDGGIIEIADEDTDGFDLVAVPYGPIRVPHPPGASEQPDRLSGASLG